MNETYKKLQEFGKVKTGELMSKNTTFKIGGPADYFIIVEENDKLVELLKYLQGEGLEYFILGGGSNILVNDGGFKGVVIRMQNTSCEIQDDIVIVESGCTMAKLTQTAMKEKLLGMEWSVGLPGTIGGAVRGNSAYSGKYTADVVEKVEVFRDGEILEISQTECEFSNKESIFKHNTDIILRVWVKLRKITSEQDLLDSRKEMMEQIKYRTCGQPTKSPSAGCAFKNYVIKNEEEKAKFKNIITEEKILNILEKYGKVPVGWMIDNLGLKGKQVGGAKISDDHANFIINFDNAKAEDVINLINEVKDAVRDKFGVEIEEEVQIV